jgi:beta-N-acetylhexosaminidase
MRYKELARLYTSQMTLDEEIGQLMVVTYSTNEYSQDLDYMLNQQHVGGVIMYQLSFEHQLQTADQVKHDVTMMQQRATFPAFVSIDEEGWNVDRLGAVYPVPPNPKRLAADDIHQTGDTAVATSEGVRVAHDMTALGINVNFAPDVDVATYHGYIDWDYRAFGGTTDDVLKYSAPYLEAMQKGGVIGTLKHFVGLGAVPKGNANDPHFTLPSVDLTMNQLTPHLATFKHFIQSPNKLDHPGFIMPTDLMVPSVDPKYPTEFSHTFITDILRNQLGYDGVVITDGLQMGGVQLNGMTLTEANASVLALQAGCDMLLDIAGSEQVTAVNAAIKSAIQDGTLSKARIDESVQRILELKMERNVVPSVQGIDMTV